MQAIAVAKNESPKDNVGNAQQMRLHLWGEDKLNQYYIWITLELSSYDTNEKSKLSEIVELGRYCISCC